MVDSLNAAGLTTRGNRRRPPQPLSLNQFYEILGDPYYAGRIVYEGELYPGRHLALISQVLFDRVQRVLALRGGGTRQRTHKHHLKGDLCCHRCGRRFIIMRGHGNGGAYFSFICRGRQTRDCDQPYLRVENLETAVERHYATVRLREDFLAKVRQELDEALLTSLGSVQALKRRLTSGQAELDTKADHYLAGGRPRLAEGQDPDQAGRHPSRARRDRRTASQRY